MTVMKNTKKLVYCNINPEKKLTGDCVIRAIALALGLTWYEASDMLYLNARNCSCEMSELKCYSRLLDNMPELERIDKPYVGYTIGELCDLLDDGIYLLRIEGHLTCMISKKVFDIWNCLDYETTAIWRVKE